MYYKPLYLTDVFAALRGRHFYVCSIVITHIDTLSNLRCFLAIDIS